MLYKMSAMMTWIVIWTKLVIYRANTDPIKWACRGFGFMLQSFMIMWILHSKIYFNISHRKRCLANSLVRLEE